MFSTYGPFWLCKCHLIHYIHVHVQYRLLVLSGRTKRGYVLHIHCSGNSYFVVSNVRD